jgi:hypothetical protein
MNRIHSSGSIFGTGEHDMGVDPRESEFVRQQVTYTLQIGDRLVVVERVPARVSVRTGERFFAPETVERLQQIVWEQQTPVRVMETPVFTFPTSVS